MKGGNKVSPKMGQKIKEKPKNVRLDLRLTESQAEDLKYCADKLKTSRTDIINKGVNEVKMKLFEEEIKNFIKGFEGKYTLLDYGISGDDYLSNGFWLKLRANFNVQISSFDYGGIRFEITGNDIYVNKGYLNEIGAGLCMIH